MQTHGGAYACKTYQLVVLLLLCVIPATVQYYRQIYRQAPAVSIKPRPVIYELRGAVEQTGIYRYAENQTPAALAAACGAEYAPTHGSNLTITGGTRLLFTGTGITASRMDAAALLSYQQPIALKTASVEDLELIPGIGSKSARALIDYRERAGPVQRIEQLAEVRGIGPKTIKKLKHYLTP